jgi:hypothetical protein
MAIIDQLPNSTLSLEGNGFQTANNRAAWGYDAGDGNIQEEASRLHNEFSINGQPNVRIVDFNRVALGGVTVPSATPSTLDELDPIAPNNWQAGTGGVVSQIYKSVSGRKYRDLGPQPGRY